MNETRLLEQWAGRGLGQSQLQRGAGPRPQSETTPALSKDHTGSPITVGDHPRSVLRPRQAGKENSPCPSAMAPLGPWLSCLESLRWLR